jgi:hypothetical protein
MHKVYRVTAEGDSYAAHEAAVETMDELEAACTVWTFRGQWPRTITPAQKGYVHGLSRPYRWLTFYAATRAGGEALLGLPPRSAA